MSRIINSGVTIITSTIRPSCIKNIFANYRNQRWPSDSKELIILLNKNNMDIAVYKKMARKIPNVRVCSNIIAP